jgi:hypothetical protein
VCFGANSLQFILEPVDFVTLSGFLAIDLSQYFFRPFWRRQMIQPVLYRLEIEQSSVRISDAKAAKMMGPRIFIESNLGPNATGAGLFIKKSV